MGEGACQPNILPDLVDGMNYILKQFPSWYMACNLSYIQGPVLNIFSMYGRINAKRLLVKLMGEEACQSDICTRPS